MEAKYYRPITKTLFFAALGLLLFMTSCKKEHDGLLRADMASFSVNNNQKAYIDAERYNCFEIGEKVRVNNSTGDITALERNDRQCDISGVPSATNYYAFYPSDLMASNENLSSGVNGKGVTLPRVQEYKYVNGHQSIQNPMAAELLNADNDNYTLHFHNLCALFKVNIHTRAAFDAIKISIVTNENVHLSGAGTVIFSNTGDYNNRKIKMNNSGVFSDVTLSLPQSHSGKPGGESFYIVVPAFKIGNNSANNKLVLEILNGNDIVRKYEKQLSKDNEIKANHIYTLGTFMFDIGLFSVRDGKTVIFAPGNLQWSYTGGGTTPTTHNINGATGYDKGTWRFAEHQYDFIGADNVNALGRSIPNPDNPNLLEVYTNESGGYTGWIDLFGWGSSGYMDSRPFYYNYPSEGFYCPNSSLGNYDWGTFNTIYNPNTNTNDPAGTWYTLPSEEWNYVLNVRGDDTWWRFNAVHVISNSDTIFRGVVLYPDTTKEKPTGISHNLVPNDRWTQYTISKEEYDILESYGCAFLPSAGRMFHTAGAYNLSDIGKHGQYWAGDADNGKGHWVYINDAVGVSNFSIGAGVQPSTMHMFSVRLAHVVKDNSSSTSD